VAAAPDGAKAAAARAGKAAAARMATASRIAGEVTPRRAPRQQRSRERLEHLLATARELIARKGNDAVSMREIADAAGVHISSVYQYFPDRNAILWLLVEADLAAFDAEWNRRLAGAQTVAGVRAAAAGAFDALVLVCQRDPSFVQLWSSVQANAKLVQLDRAANARLAAAYAERMHAIDERTDREAVRVEALLATNLASAVLSLAVATPEDADALLAAFRRMLRRGIG
jgi:AcrR family transcriptional regulator